MSANWGDIEIRALLTLRAEDEIDRHITGTVKDGPILERLARQLRELGFTRDKAQVTSKLKSLRKKFHQVNDHDGTSGRGQWEWPYFDLCQSIWGTSNLSTQKLSLQGTSHSAHPVLKATPVCSMDVLISEIKTESDMDSHLRVGFIGAGNMAFGIAQGMMAGDIPPTNVKVSAPSPRNFGRFQELGVSVTHSNAELVSSSDLVFIAVKPHLVPTVLSEISEHVTQKHIIVSVAAGVTVATLEGLLPVDTVVLRLMPNLPCLLQEGALLFSRGSQARPEHSALLSSVLQHCGLVEEGPEAWIDIHTGLSGSGVAFVYLFAESLAEGAVKMGMPSALAHSIASQTILGAGRLLRESGKHPAQLRSEVCTPGGTTIFGLHALEQGGVRAATMSAVEAATERARELGRKSATTGNRK